MKTFIFIFYFFNLFIFYIYYSTFYICYYFYINIKYITINIIDTIIKVFSGISTTRLL